MILATPAASDIINASATATTAGIVSIPAGKWLTAEVQIAASITLAATATPRVTFSASGSGFAPASGSTLARLSLTGIALTTITDSDTTEILVYGGDSGATLDFNVGGASSASVTVNGMLL